MRYCTSCEEVTEHKAGSWDDYPEKSGWIPKGTQRIFQRVRRCQKCPLGFSTVYEIPDDEYNRLIAELETLRQLNSRRQLQNL
jgi:hypothetical protein